MHGPKFRRKSSLNTLVVLRLHDTEAPTEVRWGGSGGEGRVDLPPRQKSFFFKKKYPKLYTHI
jgi:hypothetical protein